MKEYAINEIFYSIQGEGLRAGTANVFVRFSGCNLQCSAESEGFDCDTEFISGRLLTSTEIIAEMIERQKGQAAQSRCNWAVLTGGEPALQLDDFLVTSMKESGFKLAIETNGTRELPDGLDWICCSPKTAEHTLRLQKADELKYVRRYGQGIPKPAIKTNLHLLSPAVQPDGQILPEDLAWCIELVKHNPEWRLSVQQHKQWRIR